MKDWTGNTNSIFKTLGSSQHSEGEREQNDYYATDPIAIKLLLNMHRFDRCIWEPACGEGHLSKEMLKMGYAVESTDLIDRGFGFGGIDFLQCNDEWEGDIITNPPYTKAKEFIEHALRLIRPGKQVAMFLKVQFMEGKGRKKLFCSTPPKIIYVSSSRINCAKNGDFVGLRTSGGSAVAYAWYVWEKGFNGDTIVKWFN